MRNLEMQCIPSAGPSFTAAKFGVDILKRGRERGREIPKGEAAFIHRLGEERPVLTALIKKKGDVLYLSQERVSG